MGVTDVEHEDLFGVEGERGVLLVAVVRRKEREADVVRDDLDGGERGGVRREA